MTFKKYNLTESQLKQIARLCQQEQGSVAGAKAEASLMANQLELDKSRQNKYGTGADGLYNWVRNGKWYSKAQYWMDNGPLSSSILEAVRDVLVNGNRTLPLRIDEHDAKADIKSISTGSVSDRSAYVKDKTIVKNVYGSTWTFYCFPDKYSDAFGYTAEAKRAAEKLGETDVPDQPEQKMNETVKYDMYVTASSLNVRFDAGTENETTSFSPLEYGEKVGYCDTKKDSNGNDWSFIKYGTKYGFVSSAYLSKDKPVNNSQDDTKPVSDGTPQSRVIDIAYDELGYLEKASNSQLDSKTANAGDKNYTKYARDCFPDLQGLAYCDMFVNWCFVKAFGRSTASKMLGGLTADCDESAQNFKDMGRFYKSPKVGDQILFIKNGNDYYHTGIVIEVTPSSVICIEGNTSSGTQVIPNGGAVCKKTYTLGNSKIGGYGRPRWDLAPSSTPSADTDEKQYNESVKWTGYVQPDSMNVRTEPNKDSATVSFSPLSKGTSVGVCDEITNENGVKWYFIQYNGKKGFCMAKFIEKTQPSGSGSSTGKITPQKFLDACKAVVDRARKEGWHYGDSHTLPPCIGDKTISCDRLAALALWMCGYHDQRQGGETCGTLDAYLTKHGWQKVLKKKNIKPGAVVAVKNKNQSWINHVFVVKSYNIDTDLCDKYDTGSNERIRIVQPFKNVKLVQWADREFVAAWNVPNAPSEAVCDYDGLRLFKKASVDSQVITRLPKGTVMQLDGKTDGIFTHVTINGNTGWVKTKYIILK